MAWLVDVANDIISYLHEMLSVAKEDLWDYYNGLPALSFANVAQTLLDRLSSQPTLVYLIVASLPIIWLYHRLDGIPILSDYFLAESCRIHWENIGPYKVGDDVICAISVGSGFIPTGSKFRDVTGVDVTESFFNGITARIELENQHIPAIKGFTEDEQGKIKLAFTANKCGTYDVDLRYNGFGVPGNPFKITVSPDVICAEESEVIVPSTPVLITDNMPQTITIYPKDRTGYPCSDEGLSLDKFDFNASAEKSYRETHGKLCQFIGDGWKENLDACFSFFGGSVRKNRFQDRVSIMLVLRVNSLTSYGIFEGCVTYDGRVLKNGTFPIVSLTPDEYAKLEPTLEEPRPSDVTQLKAEIFQPSVQRFDVNNPTSYGYYSGTANTVLEETKEVYLNVSLKFICVKEVAWTVLLTRAALFPVQGDTKISVRPETDAKEKYIVTITDPDDQLNLIMSASNARMLMALYMKFRAFTEGTPLSFTEKEEYFFDFLKAHVTRTTFAHEDSFQLLKISSLDLLTTSLEETKRFTGATWYNPFIVAFAGEPLLDGEAGYLKWFDLLVDTMLENNPIGMFCNISEVSRFIHPNPSRNNRRWCLQYYELAGKLLGKSLVERVMTKGKKVDSCRMNVRFSRAFLQQIIGSTPNALTLERDIPEFYQSILTTLTKQNLASGLVTFTVPEYDVYGKLDRMASLVENGENVLVTEDNMHTYLNALSNYQLKSKVAREIQAFRAGFTAIIPEEYLLNFDENEFELLICGWSKLDVFELKKFCKIISEERHPEFPRVIKWFWNSLVGISPIDQAKFLQFITGSSILPPGGFSRLQPLFNIRMSCSYGQLPVADPTTHCICLSDQRDFETFQTALLTAIRTSPCCQPRPNKGLFRQDDSTDAANNASKIN